MSAPVLLKTYDPQVCESVRPNHMLYFDQILQKYACQHYLTTGMHNNLF